MKFMTLMLTIALTLNAFPKAYAQDKNAKIAKPNEVFEKVEVLVMNGKKVEKLPARLRLEEKTLIVESKKSGDVLKSFSYDSVKSGEYSYSRHPRWKAGTAVGGGGLALGALMIAGGLYTGLIVFFAAPGVGGSLTKSRSRRHWLSLRSGDDYTVLQLDKSDYKYLLVAIETRTGVKVEDVGEKR